MRGLRQRAALDRLGAPGMVGSVGFHVLVVATFAAAGGLKGRPLVPPVYKVTLVAPLGSPSPPPAAAPTPARRPAPRPAAPAPRPVTRPSRSPAVALSKAPPRAAPAAPATAAPPSAAKAQPAAPEAPTPKPAQSAPTASGSASGAPGGTDVATIRTEGVEFPFPGYLNNLVAQVYRRWRPPPSSAQLAAEIFFFVHRDGSVTGLQFIRRSGSFAFDLEAQGAVEAAARAAAFGALPPGYGPELLPVSFFFNPRSVR